MADPYLTANGTLKNLLGIEDADELAVVEDELSALRLIQIDEGQGPKLSGDCLRDLKNIHGFVFQDIYPWAGTTRAEPFLERRGSSQKKITTNFVSIKGRKAFAGPSLIAPSFAEMTALIRAANGFRSMKRRDFVVGIADLLIQVNETHAFREGNGRVQRAFIQLICEGAGRPIDFKVVTQERMLHASVASDIGDRSAMKRLVRDATSPERVREMKKAQNLLRKIGFDWEERYIGFVEPGRGHVAKLVGISSRHFTCVENNSSILIGWRRDLPGQTYSSGQLIEFVGRGAPTDAIAATRVKSLQR